MSNIIVSIRQHPQRLAWVVGGIGLSVAAFIALWRPRRVKPSTHNELLRKSFVQAGCENIYAMLTSLNSLLAELEALRFRSDRDRDRYELISSVITRLQGIVGDLNQFDVGVVESQPSTESIARSLWNSIPTPKAGTLSVLSDDSFISAAEEFNFEPKSVNIDYERAELYLEGIKLADASQVPFRKSRAEICGCDSDKDFAAKLWCVRQAFDQILLNSEDRRWLIQTGRSMIADLIRQDRKDPKDFFVVYDRLIDYIEDPKNYQIMVEELKFRKVEVVNIWDVLFDFILLDSFDDVRKPPSGIAALVKNSFLSQSMRESTLNNMVWSVIKVKRTRLQHVDGFISHFYDVSQVVSPILTMGYLGGKNKEFEELCLEVRDNILALIRDIFNPFCVRYSALEELTEDVRKTMISRLETIRLKLGNELLPI